MKLGCQTHFENNTYPLTLFPQLKSLGVDFIRDEIPWKYVETAKGVYTFPAPLPEYMAAAQSSGIPVLLTADFTNPLYDDNLFPFSPDGRQAFTNYVLAVLNQFPQIVQNGMLEIDNEPDSSTFDKGPGDFNPPYYFTLLLKEVYSAIKAKYPTLTVISGGLSAPDIPFIREMTSWGANKALDWFGLHPYAWDESIGWYLDQVALARGEHGPIALTEWGHQNNPDQLVRGAVLHAASNYVELSSWYQGYGDSASLLTSSGPTSLGNAFSAAKAELSLGSPRRLTIGDPACFIYRFGSSNDYVVWGRYANSILTDGTCFNSQGQAIPTPTMLSFSPVFIRNANHVTITPSSWIDNSRINFGGTTWQYLSDRGGGLLVPCQIMQYGSALFDECYGDDLHTPYFQIANTNIVEPYGASPILRSMITKPVNRLVDETYIQVPNLQSTGCDFSILHNGTTVFSGQVPGGQTATFTTVIPGIAAGDTIDRRYAATANNPSYSTFNTEANVTGT